MDEFWEGYDDTSSTPPPTPSVVPPASLVEQLADVVYVAAFEPSVRFEFVSANVVDMIGWTAEEHYADPDLVRRSLDPRDADQLAQFITARVGQPFTVTLRWMHRDGRTVWLQHRVVTALRGDGSLVAHGIARDVTSIKVVEKHLTDTERLYRIVSEHTSDVVYQCDQDGVLQWISPSVRSTLGYDARDVIGRRVEEFVSLDQDLPAIAAARDQMLEGAGQFGELEMLIRTESGSERWMAARGRVLRDEAGQASGWVVGLRDIHEQVLARRGLAASEQLFRTSMMHNPNGLVLFGLDGSVLAANPAFCEMLQREEAWMLTHNVGHVLVEEDLDAADAVFGQVSSGAVESLLGTSRMLRADGEPVWTRWGLSLIRDDDGAPEYLVGQYQDRTPEHEAEERLTFLSRYDGLTGLQNRAWISETLATELRLGRRRKASTVGVVHLDLDGFRVVNDSLGAAAGDELLQIVGERIRATVPGHAFVGRSSGDEFVVVVPGADGEELDELVTAVQRAVAVEVVLGMRRVLPSATAGIAVSRDDSTAESLLGEAALAHGSAKQSGRSHRRTFDDALAAEARRRLMVEEELRDAIARDELVVHYQPLVRLEDRMFMGFEALVRWQHPQRGLLGPDAFLSVAEDSGLVVPLGERVLAQVCLAMQDHPHFARRVSVNISAVQLADPGLVTRIIDCLDEHDVDPSRLVVEVTETAVVSQVELAQDTLGRLRDIGVGVHMDDFGTGYSSISLLRDLPVTGLKLDRRFVNELTRHDSDANVLSAGLAGLANGLGLESIAEGIETEEQAQLVQAQGWSHGQGYLFDRPLPLEHWTS